MSQENPLYTLIKNNIPSEMQQLHVVGFKFPEHVSAEIQNTLMSECDELFEKCGGNGAGIVSIDTIRNADPRKGYTWVEIAVFESPDAFIKFHAHPSHKVYGEKMAGIADTWVVIDVPISKDSKLNF